MKTPREGTRRRVLYDMLAARPGEWVEFDPAALGYSSSMALHHQLKALRENFGLDIRADGTGRDRTGKSRWRYVPGDGGVNG